MKTSIIFRRQLALFLFLNIIICLLFLVLSFEMFDSMFWGFFFLALLFLPLILFIPLMRLFTRKVNIFFNQDSLSLAILNKKETNEVNNVLRLDEIKSYNIYFPTRRFSSLKINLKSNRRLYFTFFTERLNNDQVDADVVLREFQLIIEQYNLNEPDNDKIAFLPSFFASIAGLYSIIGLSILFIIAVVVHIFVNMKTFPVTLFFGLAIILQLIVKRNAEIKLHKKMQ